MLTPVRALLRSLLPAAEECISYGLPAFRLNGRVVGGFAKTKAGWSYYPFSGGILALFEKELSTRSHTKSALHFAAGERFPKTLLTKLVRARLEEIARLGH